MSPELPRLLYAGDVPVEASAGGSALLYRLLADYPPDKLLLMEGHPGMGAPRLTNVRDGELDFGLPGRLPRRWPKWRNAALYFGADDLAGQVAARARDFGVEAVLTVSHQLAWRASALAAERLGVPLHLVNHDCWFDTFVLPQWMWPRVKAEFGRIYRGAASRLCISPYMASYYEAEYGAPGTVLYPSRAPDTPRFDAPPDASSSDGFTVAYAGSVFRQYAGALATLAGVLAETGGQLLVHSALPEALAKDWGLDAANIEVLPMLPPGELVHRLRGRAHALVLVLTDWGLNSRLCFPSKLAEYTAAGLPILVLAGRDSSPARWVQENPGVAIWQEDASPSALRALVHRLRNDRALCLRMGARALTVGQEQFGYESVRDGFFSALTGAGNSR